MTENIDNLIVEGEERTLTLPVVVLGSANADIALVYIPSLDYSLRVPVTALDAVQPVTPNREAIRAFVATLASRLHYVESHWVEGSAPMPTADVMREFDALLPLLCQPRTDAPLDPEPWNHDCGFCGGDHRLAFDIGPAHKTAGCCTWEPQEGFEQDQARYPRTDVEDER